MKKIMNLTMILMVFTALVACRSNNDVPEDTHEHEEISKVLLKVKNINTQVEQTISYVDGVPSGTLKLENGQRYRVELDFQSKHDDHYHSVNDEIREERDEHFIVFNFAGVQPNLYRQASNDVRTDGHIVGLASEWEITSAPASPARVQISLLHKPTSVNSASPSASQQFGTATGGDADVEMNIEIK